MSNCRFTNGLQVYGLDDNDDDDDDDDGGDDDDGVDDDECDGVYFD